MSVLRPPSLCWRPLQPKLRSKLLRSFCRGLPFSLFLSVGRIFIGFAARGGSVCVARVGLEGERERGHKHIRGEEDRRRSSPPFFLRSASVHLCLPSLPPLSPFSPFFSNGHKVLAPPSPPVVGLRLSVLSSLPPPANIANERPSLCVKGEFLFSFSLTGGRH